VFQRTLGLLLHFCERSGVRRARLRARQPGTFATTSQTACLNADSRGLD
jgi:hypothetical protein